MSPEKRRPPVEWGGFLRKLRSSDGAQAKATTPDLVESTPPPAQRRAWASGAFLAAAARLVARGEESGYTLRRVVEWATAATGARRAALWAIEPGPDGKQQLTILAWAAIDGWRPAEEALPAPQFSPALQQALRNPETVAVNIDSPAEARFDWLRILGTGPIALCAAISSGEARGVLAVAGNNAGVVSTAPFGEDARAALAACAALAAIVFDRQKPAEQPEDVEAAADPADVAAIAGQRRLFQELPDRAAMLAQLKMEISRAERFGHPLALLGLDIDHFGEWAQQAGTNVADDALDHVTALIRASIRDVDVLGRDGDDSFVLILPVSEADDALRVGERVEQALRDNQPLGPDGIEPLTLSGGAVGHPDDGATADALLDSTERTITYAKRMGRDQIRVRGLGEMESPSMGNTDRLSAERAAAAAGAAAPLVAQAFQGLVDALTTAGDAHDQARPGHGRAVGRYARALAEACGLDPEQARAVELAGTLHDAGKIGLPVEILAKRGPLTCDERAVLREQPAVGKLILMQIPSLESVIPLILQAHERFDGAGHPDGLHGNQISFGARIIAIAEGYEAMTNDRPYRKALTHSMTIAELWREAGKRYDPRLVDTFVRIVSPLDAALGDEAWKPELLERVAIDGEAPAEPAPRPSTGTLGARSLLPSSAPLPALPALDDAVDTADDEAIAAGEVEAEWQPALEAQLSETEGDDSPEPLITGETAWLTWSDIAQPPTRAEFWGPQDASEVDALAAELVNEADWDEDAEQPEAIYYEEVISATRLELNTGELVPPPSLHAEPPSVEAVPDQRPRPTTGSLIAPGLVPFPEPAEEVAGLEAQTAEAEDDDDDEESPERLSVDDTMLVVSQTTLLRLNELQRLTKRRTGYLYTDRQEGGKK